MTVADGDGSGLLADLWDLVEGWSSGAIQRAREAAAPGPTEADDAEIRLLVAHAAELRGVIEAHLDRMAPDPVHTVHDEDDDATAAEDATATEDATEAEDAAGPPHTCNSADFDRPPCDRCSGRHWYCSICGAQQDDCPAAS